MFKKSFFVIIALSFLLSGCDFRPKHKVIEYQEEVKLSDGSMIWVDIKRHYGWSGYAPGMGSGAYLPGIVEISWDTGFPNVGRKSLTLLEKIYLIDKIDGKWYVISNTHGSAADFKSFHNCVEHSTYTPRLHISPICLTIINPQGQFEKLPKGNTKEVVFNILNADALSGEPTSAEQLNGKQVSWQDKIIIQQSTPEFTRNVGKTYQAYSTSEEKSHD